MAQSKNEFCPRNRRLATLDVGISKCISPDALFTVSQRAIRHAMQSLNAHRRSAFGVACAETMRYFYSSNILWAWNSMDIYLPYAALGHQLKDIRTCPAAARGDARRRAYSRQPDNYFHKVVVHPPSEPADLMYNTKDIAHPPGRPQQRNRRVA